jgi:hypothetical protein
VVSIEFVEKVLRDQRSYHDLKKIEYIVSQIVSKQTNHNDEDYLSSVCRILSSLKKSNSTDSAVEKIIETLALSLPKLGSSISDKINKITEKIIRKIILISLQQKQQNPTFNLHKIHNQLKNN